MSDKKIFEYTYSAPTEEERKEILSIKSRYTGEYAGTEDKYSRIKALDNKVKGVSTAIGLIFGVVGLLIFGLGLTIILEWSIWLWGVILMVVACIPMVLAYPSYTYTHKKLSDKYRDEIVKLSDELLNQ